MSSTPPTSHNSPSTHNQPPSIPHRNAISQQRLWEVVLKNMSLHCGVQSVELFCGIHPYVFSPAICYRSYLWMKNDLYCPLWTAFWPRSAFGWFIKKSLSKAQRTRGHITSHWASKALFGPGALKSPCNH